MSQDYELQIIDHEKYAKLEREVQLKINIVDIGGIQQLKNKLLQALDELLELETDLAAQVRQFENRTSRKSNRSSKHLEAK